MLLEELDLYIKNLATQYHEPEMRKIINDYCNMIITTVDDKVTAEKYVLDTDKFDFQQGKTLGFNEGHIYSGILYSEKLNKLFIKWYEENYLTYKDINDTYNSITDVIIHNLDYRMGTYAISMLLENGLETMKDVDNIKQALKDIDKRHDEYEANNRIPLTSRSFDKATIKTCYKIANNFTPMQILEYISKDLDFKYEDSVSTTITVDRNSVLNRAIELKANNNMDMVEALSNALDQIYNYYEESVGYEEAYNNLLDTIESESMYVDYESKIEIADDYWVDEDEYEDTKKFELNKYVYGYVYDDRGMHNGKIPFENTFENIANFISYNDQYVTKVTDSFDNLIVSSTVGGFLDRVSDPETRDNLLKHLLPLQYGEIEPYNPADINALSEKGKDKSL